MNEEEIVRMYVEDMMSMGRIAAIFGVKRPSIRKVLLRADIQISTKGRIIRSEEFGRKVSLAKKGKPSGAKGRKVTNPDVLFKNMKAHLKFDVPLSWLTTFELPKMMCLNKMARNDRLEITRDWYIAYIERFHDDVQFNKVYETWLTSGKEHLAQPTLDHKIPVSRGGDNDVGNLQVISWIENRMKNTMTQDEWVDFKRLSKLSSTYIYESPYVQ